VLKAVLTIDLDSIKTAQAVDNALSADNINLPKGMKIAQTRRGKKLKISVEVKDALELNTLIATLDEFLAHSDAAVKVLG
jgi:hypothetical protein